MESAWWKRSWKPPNAEDAGDIVTILELLSPGNKRLGSDGRDEYMNKRAVILDSQTHLLELDLLRGGRRLPTLERLPSGDHYAFLRRHQRRYKVKVYGWQLQHRLPSIPVPLAADDPDVLLDLQSIFTTVYDRAGYDYALDYQQPAEPPLSDEDTHWVKEILANSMKRK